MLGLLYDVHGNRAALEAVLDDARALGVRRWLVGGDVSAFGGEPVATLERLRWLDPAAWIRGNHERWAHDPDAVPDVTLARGGVAAMRAALGEAEVERLHRLPTWAPLAAGGEAWHASPLSDVRTFAPAADAEEDHELLAGRTPALLVVGHSHLAFRRTVVRPDGGETLVVNPGSVGLPFDGDPRAAYAVLHDERDGPPLVEHRRVAYDVEAAVDALEAAHAGEEWAAIVVATLRTGVPGGRTPGSAADPRPVPPPMAAEDEHPADAAPESEPPPDGPADADHGTPDVEAVRVDVPDDGPLDDGEARADGVPGSAVPEDDPSGDDGPIDDDWTAGVPDSAPEEEQQGRDAPQDAAPEDEGPLPVLRAGGFEVVDDAGRPRARLGVQPGGGMALDLADADGRVRATVVVEPDGSAALKLADAAGTYRAALGAWLDGTTSLDLYDAERNQRLSLGEQPGHAVGLALWSDAGRLRALLGEGPAGDRDASLEFWDPDGAYRAGLGVWPDGATGAEMLDERGTMRVRLGQRTDPGEPAALELYAADGTFRVAAGEYPDGSGRVNLWDAQGTSLPAEATAPPPAGAPDVNASTPPASGNASAAGAPGPPATGHGADPSGHEDDPSAPGASASPPDAEPPSFFDEDETGVHRRP